MTTTPPLQSVAHTPSTPLHGAKHDSRQPSAVRKSTRSSTQRAVRTPSPGTQSRSLPATSLSRSKITAAHTYSPPSSPHSPQKVRRSTHTSSEAHKPSTRGSNYSPKQIHKNDNSLSSERGATTFPNMLPTPVKTPRKKAKPGLISAARVVFPNRPDTIDEAMPTPRKNGKKRQTGFSLGSFGEEDNGSLDDKIEIYTDSKDKLPEIDESEDNPFYVNPRQQPRSTGRRGKRRKVSGEEDCNKEVQEVLQRNEGMVYVFRGKKVYRKFEVDEDTDPDDQGADYIDPENMLDAGLGRTSTSRHFTRSSIKPRLLFPPQNHSHNPTGDTTDEEAITDIEDPAAHGITSITHKAETAATPVKVGQAPATPPTTVHATRSKKIAFDIPPDSDEHMAVLPPRFSVKRGRNSSPFDDWKRTKNVDVSNGKGKKRERDSPEGSVDGAKRSKNTVA